MSIRTRFAPSPTGFVHIGSIYQVLFDKAIALKNNGRFLVRIEDTDQNRYVEGAIDAVFDALDWFKLTPDESIKHPGKVGPYQQSKRLDIYQKYAKQLVDEGKAYYCFCSSERLDKVRKEQQKNKQPPMYDKHCRNLSSEEAQKRVDAGENHVIRMKIPEDQIIKVTDAIRGEIEFESKLVDDQVILKSDGYPTYHLAVVVDDHLMEITHVVRGPEWIASFPKHKVLYNFFGWEMPVFIHTPLISNMDGAKLSKRHGHSSVDWYRRKGFLPESIINFISLLGWSHPEEKEIFSFDEFVKLFDYKDLTAVSPKFDLTKLEWMNGQYIQELENSIFIIKFKEWLNYCLNSKHRGATEYQTNWTNQDYEAFMSFIESLNDEQQNLFAEITKTRLKKFEDMLELAGFFIKDIKSESLPEIASDLSKLEWTLKNLKAYEASLVEKAKANDQKIGQVFAPIRLAIAGSKISPPLFESIYLLGKDKTLKRLG